MGKVVVTSCVYLGDAAPFVPVAREVHRRGHAVTFVAPEGFRPMLDPEPFDFEPYGLDASPSAMNNDPLHTKLMRHPVRNGARLGRYWMDRAFADDADACVSSLRSGFDGADVVVTHPTMAVVTLPVAHSMGIPVVVGQLFPMMIPTTRWTPPLGSRSPDLGGPINAATWRIMAALSRFAFRDRAINTLRHSLDLEAVRGNAARAWLDAERTVVLTSQHYYGPGADDWPPVTWGGFSIWEGVEGQPLDPDLERFADTGDRPVLVTLGTSAATDAGEQFAQIARDLDVAGLRSILLVGHETNLRSVAEHPAAVTFAPITRLLPKCQVAVVSGALGGVASALTAGVPVVIHPQLFDQVWHGRRVEELGVGVMARKVSDVAPAVERIVRDPAYARRAHELAEKLVAEDGASVAADVVESLMSDSAP